MKVTAIFGPPGTGKTSKLVWVATNEFAKGARSVLYLSFTKAAALEATSRLPHREIMKPSTIHSLAFNALNMARSSIVDPPKLTAFALQTGIPFLGTESGADDLQEGDEYTNVLAYSNNRMIPVMEAYDKFGRPGTQHRFEQFCRSYRSWKEAYGFFDFDDMLARFTNDPNVKFTSPEVVVLDEAQDCSPMQWLAFIKIAAGSKRVYIAGDDDQAIYEWNGAHPHGMVDFAEVNDGEIIVLDQSYRVPSIVKSLADVTANKIERRVRKKWAATKVEGKVESYGQFWDVPASIYAEPKKSMILARDRFRVMEIKKELNRLMIPYEVLGGDSPWTNKLSEALRRGENPEIPLMWREFYEQADLTQTPRVTVSTIHQAKGREAPCVVVDLSLSTMVLSQLFRDRDAELRVLYVALTRTSDQLILCGDNPLI